VLAALVAALRGELAESQAALARALEEWSVPAFMDTELGCQLTELPIS